MHHYSSGGDAVFFALGPRVFPLSLRGFLGFFGIIGPIALERMTPIRILGNPSDCGGSGCDTVAVEGPPALAVSDWVDGGVGN